MATFPPGLPGERAASTPSDLEIEIVDDPTPGTDDPLAPSNLNGGITSNLDPGVAEENAQVNVIDMPDGSVEIEVVDRLIAAQEEPENPLAGVPFDANLAEYLPEGELTRIATDLIEDIDADITSRQDWEKTYTDGLEVLGLKYDERTEPWDGACGVYSTVLTEAAVRFQSDTIVETFPAGGPVKTQILGLENREKVEASQRVAADMNYELTEGMPEFRPEHERMLFNLGLAGAAFKKVYADPSLGRQVSVYVSADELVMPFGASGVFNAERVTHIMRKTKNEVRKLQVSGFYKDIDLGEPVQQHSQIEKKKADEQGYKLLDDDRYVFYECHTNLIVPFDEDKDKAGEETGIALPYVITIDKGTNKVLGLRRNWKEDDPKKLKRQHFAQYTYMPGFGAYGMGLIHLIGGYARAGTSLIRQLVDAGTLSNLPGGMKTRGLRVKGDDTPIGPGEWRDVDVASGALRDNIMPLPYKEPSQVLAALLERITEEGRRLGSIGDLKMSDMSAQAPVGTTLALLERQLKLMTAVQARVHYSMKQELKLLKEIIRDHTPDEYDYDPATGTRHAKKTDYDLVEIIPVSDPNNATMAQRIMQYQAAFQMSQAAPQVYDIPYLHRQMITVLGIKDPDKVVPLPDDMGPKDPVSENMGFITGKPQKAFLHQDHQAHIAAHASFMQSPAIAQTIGQNPMGQMIIAAIMSHINEHMAFQYRKEVEAQLGVPLPPPDEPLPEDAEIELSRLMAQAGARLMQAQQAQIAQQQAQQAAQDPLLQMQQAELQVKAKDAETKRMKVQGDLILDAKRLQLDEAKVIADALKPPPAPPQGGFPGKE